jgi:cob(I)alamin adenosyltransferase
MKVYTKTGDYGETSLFGGSRVSKSDLRIQAYGTVDELNSYIGLLRDMSIGEQETRELLFIQDRLFTLGAILASEKESSKSKLPQILAKDIRFLEDAIDAMEISLDPINAFVLPGGHIIVSHCHVARCICRRAERVVVQLSEHTPVDSLVINYLNRLSDYLFVLSRHNSKQLNAVEIPWIPKK